LAWDEIYAARNLAVNKKNHDLRQEKRFITSLCQVINGCMTGRGDAESAPFCRYRQAFLRDPIYID
jgi:hypothetical protein